MGIGCDNLPAKDSFERIFREQKENAHRYQKRRLVHLCASIIQYSPEYGWCYVEGDGSYRTIEYCPWCGKRLRDADDA